jgi:hypothetical protein
MRTAKKEAIWIKRSSWIAVMAAMAGLCVGCKESQPASPTGNGTGALNPGSAPGGGDGAGTGAPASAQLTTLTINDPTLNNMPAWTVTVPAGWKMQGMVMTSPCTTQPSPVFRAYSADGLTQMRFEPAIGWRWRPNQRLPVLQGCLAVQQQLTAAQFLDYYTGTIQGGVHVVGPIAITAAQMQQLQQYVAQMNAANAQSQVMAGITNTGDAAALRVEIVNGSFVVEERLRAQVICQLNRNPGPTYGGNCYARVDVLTAPQGQLDALMQMVDSNNLPRGADSPQWFQAKLQQQTQQQQQFGAKLFALQRAESQMLQQQAQQFAQMMAQNHAAFMQQQESEFQSDMANANAKMNAQSTAASDWVDYALDQQTVTMDGPTAKVSSAYSQTWTNGTQWYQTNDPSANPNGALPGNWSPATPTHGNGQAY